EEWDHEPRLVRKASEEIDREARVPGQIIAPDHLAAAEDRVEAALLGNGEPRAGEHVEGVLGDAVGRDRTQLGTVRLAHVRRDRLGAGEPGQLPADEAQRLAELAGGAGHAG